MTPSDSNDADAGQVSLAEGIERLPPPPARFAQVFSRTQTRDASFSGQKMSLDGQTFIHCHFERCVLDVSSVNYDLIGCTLDPATTITFTAPITDAMNLVSPGFPWPNQNVAAFFVPLRRNDGAILLWFAGRFM